jgi:hypothetical protein
MPSSDLFIRHLFGGGFATDLGPSTDGSPQGSGASINQMVIPWLQRCDNIMFDLDGGISKSPGTTKVNSSALESGAAIRGCYDYWIQGVAGTPTQKRVVHVGTKIKADAADGVFADIATGLSSSAVPSYATFNDTLIITDDGNTAPLKWLGTGSASALGGTPPNFAFCVEHKGRLFAAGNPAYPSRLYYSAAFDHESGWSSYITIGTDDGSGITAISSFKDALIIFKGPKKGSIYVLQGDDVTTFSLSCLRKNCGSAVWQNAVFQYQDDLAFMSADGSIQKVSATASFGNFSLGHLSRDISKWLQANVVRSRLKKCFAVNWETKGIVLFTLPINSATNPNMILMMDYRFGDNPRFSIWSAYANVCVSACLSTDEIDASRVVVHLGGSDGYLRKLNANSYSIDGATAISGYIKTPTMSYGSPHLTKTLVAGSIGFLPLTDDTVTFQWFRDNNTYDTLTVDQGGGDSLAPTSGTAFTLDTSYLGGGQFTEQWFETENGGEWRNIAFVISNADVDASFSIHSLSAFVRGSALSLENA